jgi:hypothetical protein
MAIAYPEETMFAAHVETKEEHSAPVETASAIRHYALDGLLQAHYHLALNTELGILSCFADNGTEIRLALECQFSPGELSVLIPLLDAFPYYCPYETIYASFYNGEITDRLIEQSRRRLYRALNNGEWELEMRPVRNVLSRTRIKLRAFGINVASILETGCVLRPATKTRHPRREVVSNPAG